MSRRTSKMRLRLQPLEDRTTPATFTVSNTNDAGAGSLRQAILSANGAAGADTVAFDSSFNIVRTITLTGGELVVSDTVVIDGPGEKLLTLNGSGLGRVF